MERRRAYVPGAVDKFWGLPAEDHRGAEVHRVTKWAAVALAGAVWGVQVHSYGVFGKYRPVVGYSDYT